MPVDIVISPAHPRSCQSQATPTPLACEPGMFSYSGSSNCALCPKGYMCPTPFQSLCFRLIDGLVTP